MPNYKGHLVGGVAVYGLVLCGVIGMIKPTFLTAVEWLLFTLAGALFPDIDIKSKGQKYFYYVVFLFFVVLAVQRRFEMLACFSFIIISPLLVRHRGIFHSPWFVIAVSLFAWVVVSMVKPKIAQQFFYDILFFIAGALSHIWLDFGICHMTRKLIMRKKTYK
jgi:hypothetical protein